jgi:hypothetical protein
LKKIDSLKRKFWQSKMNQKSFRSSKIYARALSDLANLITLFFSEMLSTRFLFTSLFFRNFSKIIF